MPSWLDDALDSILFGAGVLLVMAMVLFVFHVAHAGEFRRNVKVLPVPDALIWPPAKPMWAAHKSDFVKFPFGSDPAQKQPAKVCTTPPKDWHGLHLNGCSVAEDKSIVCRYKIVAAFGGSDGQTLGTWVGVIWVQRVTCTGKFIPRLAEFIPPDSLEGAADLGTEAQL